VLMGESERSLGNQDGADARQEHVRAIAISSKTKMRRIRSKLRTHTFSASRPSA
jgi:hypothetical protein